MPVEATPSPSPSQGTPQNPAPGAPSGSPSAEPQGPNAAAPQAQVEPPAREEPKERIGADRFAQLTRKEQQIVAKQRELQSARAELDAAREELAEFTRLKEQARLDPIKFLEHAGLSYEEVTSFVLNDHKPTAEVRVDAAKAEIEKLREELAEKESRKIRAEQREAQKRIEAEVQEWREGVVEQVRAASDSYELTNLYGEQGSVPELIELHYEQTGKVMPFEEAAKLVEDHLEELVTKAGASKKIKAKWQPPASPAEKNGDGKPAEQLTATRRTVVNNDMTATTPSIMRSASTDEDRVKRALAALERR